MNATSVHKYPTPLPNHRYRKDTMLLKQVYFLEDLAAGLSAFLAGAAGLAAAGLAAAGLAGAAALGAAGFFSDFFSPLAGTAFFSAPLTGAFSTLWRLASFSALASESCLFWEKGVSHDDHGWDYYYCDIKSKKIRG